MHSRGLQVLVTSHILKVRSIERGVAIALSGNLPISGSVKLSLQKTHEPPAASRRKAGRTAASTQRSIVALDSHWPWSTMIPNETFNRRRRFSG